MFQRALVSSNVSTTELLSQHDKSAQHGARMTTTVCSYYRRHERNVITNIPSPVERLQPSLSMGNETIMKGQ